MTSDIPTYIERRVQGGQSIYLVRPLFFDLGVAYNHDLDRAMQRYRKMLHQSLEDLAKSSDHRALASALYAPDYHTKLVEWSLDLRKRTLCGTWLYVVCQGLGRKLAFSPRLPEMWLELPRGEKLEHVVEDALTTHFRKELDAGEELPEEELVKRAWTTELSLSFGGSQELPKEEDPFAALFGSSEESLSGANELRTVGHCLDDDLQNKRRRLQGFDSEVQELLKALTTRSRRAVLLVGPSLVGKSAIIREAVRQRLEGRTRKAHDRGRCWLLSPQRLIAGMSYVGQWENRVHAIMAHARKRNLVLYFNDLVGLLWAGRSSGSDLNVASLLKMYLEDEAVRVVAEATPEVFRRVRELDRAFADQFQVLRISEPSEEEVLSMTIGIRRRLEIEHRCWFSTDVVPVALNLQRRFFRHLAFPGKVAALLERIASNNENEMVTAHTVYRSVADSSGVNMDFITGWEKLERQALVGELSASVIGQPGAVDALADVFMMARAGLNDPTRPLGVFVFLGPTGVGKTQAAKSAAKWLLGSADRLLRFDMNEYAEPGAAQRLLGTPWDPEGALTGAVRRQPFGVLLLDEIEKAHREVYDLLLQVTGEGRLTDALGRTVDFSNMLIILTTNLGAREAMSRAGFVTSEDDRQASYMSALGKWFRPEFINRLDAVVPFRSLSPDDIAQVARLCLQEVLGRSGIVRRKCLVEVDDDVAHTIGQEGYHPLLGARALKRHIEQKVAQPIAERLAAIDASEPVLLELKRSQAEPFVRPIRLRPIVANSAASVVIDSVPDCLERLFDWLEEVADTLDGMAPCGPMNEETLAGDDGRYFAAIELYQRLKGRAEHLQRDLNSRRKIYRGPRQFAKSRPSDIFTAPEDSFCRQELARRFSLADALEPGTELVPLLHDSEPRLRRLLADAAWLHACLQPGADSATLRVDSGVFVRRPLMVLQSYKIALEACFDMEVEAMDDGALRAVGPGVARLLAGEVGMHILRQVWMSLSMDGVERSAEVVRIHEDPKAYDVSTGWFSGSKPADLATLLIGRLPLPEALN